MFAKASSSVAPCDQQPGRPRQETLYPSSVGIKATEYFIRLTVAFELFRRMSVSAVQHCAARAKSFQNNSFGSGF
jgi:hypothetical protein